MNEESLFAAALEILSGDERNHFLDKECGDDVDLRQRMEVLLRAHEALGGILDQPNTNLRSTVGESPEAVESPAPIGTVMAGRYRLIELIGEGGMGDVFFAEQTVPVRRKVAIKLTKPGLQSRSVLARFEKERQALAVMDHPNIAKVLDGGVTETGQPFFVMEYLKGLPITQYCDDVCMPIRQRLELFSAACQAVQHAHQKGIIHRDLKPSNILVALYDEKPVVKVIDFGLAKGIDQPLLDGTNVTGHAVLLGTPRYMSPEQTRLNNLDIDTRSDIYSLGVVLYELLTGSTPVDQEQFQAAGWDERLRMIRDVDPPTPSTRLNASKTLVLLGERRQLQPARLCRTVRGELDWIVMKALEKDRERRYESAGALEKDVKNYLQGEPVAASPPSRIYRLSKLARRNKVAIGAGTAVVLSLAIGLAVASVGLYNARLAAVAERQATLDAQVNELQAIEAVERFVNVITSNKEMKNRAELAPLRSELMKEPIDYYDALSQRLLRNDHFNLKSATKLLSAMREFAHANHALADRKDTLTVLESCLRIANLLVQTVPREPSYRIEQAQLHSELARLYFDTGKNALALSSQKEADRIYSQLIQEFPEVIDYQTARADSLLQIGKLVLAAEGDTKYAVEAIEESKELLAPLLARNPSSAGLVIQQGTNLLQIAEILFSEGKKLEAMESVTSAAKLIEQISLETAHDKLHGSILLAGCFQFKALVLSRDEKMEEAIAAREEAQRILDQVVMQFPYDVNYRGFQADGWRRSGWTLFKAGELKKAQAELERAVLSLESLVRECPNAVHYRTLLFDSLSCLRSIARKLEDEVCLQTVKGKLSQLMKNAPAEQLSDLLKGSEHASPVELTDLAYRAYTMHRFDLAFKLFCDALEREPQLQNDRGRLHAYNAACCASLCLDFGVGEMQLDETKKSDLRVKAYGWLRAELDSWRQIHEQEPSDAKRTTIAKTMKHWQRDTDLEAVRDPAQIDILPEEERQQWKSLWERVEKLRLEAVGDSSKSAP